MGGWNLHIDMAIGQAGGWVRGQVEPSSPMFRIYSDTLFDMRDQVRRSNSRWAEGDQLAKSFSKSVSHCLRKPDQETLKNGFTSLYQAMFRAEVPPEILDKALASQAGRGIG